MSGREREFREYVRSRTVALHRTAYMLCGDWHIAQDLTQETPVRAAATEPYMPDSAEEIVEHAELFQALLRLPLRQRATVVLRYLDGLSERETATALGCSQGTVKSQTSRALNSLRTFLDRTESTL